VRPRHLLSEFAEEGRRSNGSAVAAAYVGKVGEITLERLCILFGEMQWPRAIFSAYAGFYELANQHLIVAEHARVVMAECDHTRAREGGTSTSAAGLKRRAYAAYRMRRPSASGSLRRLPSYCTRQIWLTSKSYDDSLLVN
jgi:hypothetical protein